LHAVLLACGTSRGKQVESRKRLAKLPILVVMVQFPAFVA